MSIMSYQGIFEEKCNKINYVYSVLNKEVLIIIN
jgi:hypothetical protein